MSKVIPFIVSIIAYVHVKMVYRAVWPCVSSLNCICDVYLITVVTYWIIFTLKKKCVLNMNLILSTNQYNFNKFWEIVENIMYHIWTHPTSSRVKLRHTTQFIQVAWDEVNNNPTWGQVFMLDKLYANLSLQSVLGPHTSYVISGNLWCSNNLGHSILDDDAREFGSWSGMWKERNGMSARGEALNAYTHISLIRSTPKPSK